MIKHLQRTAVALLVSAVMNVNAFAADGYREISPPQPTLGSGKIEVLEFFWYGCPHCNRFHPILEQWKKTLPDDVVFRPVAAVLNPSWVNHARAWYAAEIMGETEKFHDAMFRTFHKDRQRIFKLEDLADLAAKQGIDREKFLATMTSFAVQTKLRRSKQMSDAYQINGVPTVTVAGKYVTSGSMAGSYPRAIQIINELIEKERAAN